MITRRTTRTGGARLRRATGALLVLLPLAACAVESEEGTSRESEPLVNGTSVAVTNQGVVRLTSANCSAALLNNNWALTAAHCGSRVGDSAVMGSQVRKVARVVRHPDVALGIDVALVKLSAPMTMNGSTSGFRRVLRRSVAPVGSTVRCFGYGRSFDGPGTDATLRTVQLKIVSGANNEYIFQPTVPGQSVATGDAGGPCFDDDGSEIGALRTFAGSGPPSFPGEAYAVTSDYYVNWADWQLAGFADDFGTLVQNYSGLDFGLPSSWEPISGDFNGDGKTDYARVGSTGAWLFFSNGDGTFSTGFQDYGGLAFGAPSSWQTITGDFNGDGKTDYARLGDTGAWVFLGNASGSFTTGFQVYPSLNFGLPSSWQPITGDFNGDGKTDYARLGDTGAWVFLGNASGSFTTGFQVYPSLNFGLPSSWQPITGDFNGDGKTDYARLGDSDAWVFLGNADGSFTTSTQIYPSLNFGLPSSWQPITGDFNGDGKTDYARLGDTGAWIFFGGDGGAFTTGFQSYEGLTFGTPSAWQVVTGNFKGDAKTSYARLGGSLSYIFVHR